MSHNCRLSPATQFESLESRLAFSVIDIAPGLTSSSVYSGFPNITSVVTGTSSNPPSSTSSASIDQLPFAPLTLSIGSRTAGPTSALRVTPGAPVTFDNATAGFNYTDRATRRVFLSPSTAASRVNILSIELLGEGFISPDLAATSFPQTLSTPGTISGVYLNTPNTTGYLDVYLSSSTPGLKSGTLRVTTDTDTLDFPLSGTVDAPFQKVSIETYEGLVIGNGQSVDFGPIAVDPEGDYTSIGFSIYNRGNAPIGHIDYTVDDFFTPDNLGSGGSAGSGSVTTTIGGTTLPTNLFADVEVPNPPGILPNSSIPSDFDVPITRTGRYNATALIRTDVPGAAQLSFKATAKVVRGDFTEAPPKITGKILPPAPAKGTVTLSSISSSTWQSDGLPIDLENQGYQSPVTVIFKNTLPIKYIGTVYISLHLTNQANNASLIPDQALDLTLKPGTNKVTFNITVPNQLPTGLALGDSTALVATLSSSSSLFFAPTAPITSPAYRLAAPTSTLSPKSARFTARPEDDYWTLSASFSYRGNVVYDTSRLTAAFPSDSPAYDGRRYAEEKTLLPNSSATIRFYFNPTYGVSGKFPLTFSDTRINITNPLLFKI